MTCHWFQGQDVRPCCSPRRCSLQCWWTLSSSTEPICQWRIVFDNNKEFYFSVQVLKPPHTNVWLCQRVTYYLDIGRLPTEREEWCSTMLFWRIMEAVFLSSSQYLHWNASHLEKIQHLLMVAHNLNGTLTLFVIRRSMYCSLLSIDGQRIYNALTINPAQDNTLQKSGKHWKYGEKVPVY